MKKHVNEEVTEFLKFLQNSAKKCAQDYNMLSDDAHLFTEVKKKKKPRLLKLPSNRQLQHFTMCDDPAKSIWNYQYYQVRDQIVCRPFILRVFK